MKIVVGVCVLAALPISARAQTPASVEAPQRTEHTQTNASSGRWFVMQDGVIQALFNRQGGPRGGREFVVPNWWMGMFLHEKGHRQFSVIAMLSLDAATVGREGYREIFQAGEVLDSRPLVDRQHPHDFFMQLAASWRARINDRTSVVIAGGPSGEPTLGPTAFMHRPSAAGLPLAPLGHHTFDSTHISFGVVTGALERDRWTFEAGVFNSREPDDRRWDFDFGRMDSVAGRVWFRPTREWDLQVSTSRLRDPEALTPGDVIRTTASASWFKPHEDSLAAFTAAYGVNAEHGERRQGGFAEASVERGANAIFGRLEVQQVESALFQTGTTDSEAIDADAPAVAALTLGATRRLFRARGFDTAIGAGVTTYRVPAGLRASHGDHPLSFQVFVRLRLPTGPMGRMWNMRMSRGHGM